MSLLLHQIVLRQAERSPSSKALGCKDQWFDYQTVSRQIRSVAAGLQKLGLMQHERVAIYLPKTPEAVFSYFGATAAGGVMVPVNPVLKAPQVFHILKDCNVRVLMTNKARYQQLEAEIHQCHDLMQVILVDGDLADEDLVNNPLSDSAFGHRQSANPMNWANFLKPCAWWEPVSSIDADMAAILYTSGSTGKPKGVVLSHRNMVTGASSVAQYLGNTPEDRLLCVLPFSFDYGFSQLTTAFLVGASCYLLEYLLPRDVIKTVEKQQITGLGLVPPLWVQIADLPWPQGAGDSLRYFTNTGGAMPTATLALLRQRFRHAKPYLMYGLTEAFRSCFLPPEQIDLRPGSMGKAIPNADVMVINELGEICGPHEPGELVHRGALVSMGYWNDPERTAERFRPAPCAIPGIPGKELAVWSGDIVRKDDNGYIYFVGRRDDMIKTSGYRVSPTEVEEVVYSSGLVAEVAAIGVPHFRLGQAIVLVVVSSSEIDEPSLIRHCQQCLPAYMVPIRVIQQTTLARNPNGKIDRKPLLEAYRRLFQDEEAPVFVNDLGQKKMTKGHHRLASLQSRDNQLLIAGYTAADLVTIAGSSPCYIYDRQALTQRVAQFRQQMPAELKLHYAIKANPMPAVVGHMAQCVDGLDVASHREMLVALGTGMAAANISFAGPAKGEHELRAAVAAGITINIESPLELQRLYLCHQQLGIRPRIAFRVNPDFELKTSGMKMAGGPKQFGIDAEQMPSILAGLDLDKLDFQGFHIFSGSQNLKAESLIECHQQTFELAARLADLVRAPVRHINIGGGLGIPYFPGEQTLTMAGMAENLQYLLDHRPDSLKSSEVVMELGRWLVGEAGYYICQVTDKKESRGQAFLMTNGGLHHHLSNSGNFGQVIRKNYPVVLAHCLDSGEQEVVEIVGPLCTPLDVVGAKLALPKAEVGDFIVVLQSGAYGATASPQKFLGHPEVVELLL